VGRDLESSLANLSWLFAYGDTRSGTLCSTTPFNTSCIFYQNINTETSGVATVNGLVASGNSTIIF